MTNPMQKALDALKLAPKCAARCRTTGQPCKNARVPNGRCRMHGGKSTGRPITTGEHTKDAKALRREIRHAIREAMRLMNALR